ncbi:unnamed protein product [Linum tenue]|uniref:RING-type domain-containing protein n=2 Tax=Linum tenue TaxID=586396 RepID=A0AAV0HR73_9ROSI|nr:unnamed protein product [Linum tenue]
MLYYGLVVVGTAAVVLALYNVVIIRFCIRHRRPPSTPGGSDGETANHYGSRGRRRVNNLRALSSFKYRKQGREGGSDDDGGGGGGRRRSFGESCAVCLCAFEEGEEVWQLPNCGHRFHVACIDMWLYSHPDCPLCRAAVQISPPLRPITTTTTTTTTSAGAAAVSMTSGSQLSSAGGQRQEGIVLMISSAPFT